MYGMHVLERRQALIYAFVLTFECQNNQGDGAPSEAHPDNIRKGHGGKVNFEQCLPRQSKECLENSEEYTQLTDVRD
jgi:hypothetical protein